MGLLAKSTRGLGTLNVSGLSRVPNPPTKIKAFMVRVEISSQQPQQSKVGPNGRKGIPEIFAPNSKIPPTYQNCHFEGSAEECEELRILSDLGGL
jgi:hypothetical protein